MKINKGIWKTAVLAAAITLVGSMFIMRLDDWSKGLNSGFIVYGQSGTTGTTSACSPSSGTSGTTSVCVIKVIPHVVAGGKYKTTIQIINTSGATVNVSGDFFNQDGTKSTATFTQDLNGKTATFVGSMTAASLAANAVLVISVEKDGALFVNWGEIIATSNVSVSAAFELRETAKDPVSGKDVPANLLSRVGVTASPADMQQFVIPRIRNVSNALDVGYAIANTGSTAATITVTLRDASGQNTLATKSLTLNAMSQTAIFANEFFGVALNDKDSATKTGYQSLTFTSDKGQFAAMALAIEGPNLASFPVDRIQ